MLVLRWFREATPVAALARDNTMGGSRVRRSDLSKEIALGNYLLTWKLYVS